MTLRHLAAAAPTAEGVQVVAGIARQAGALAPVLTLHAAAPRVLAAVWAMSCATLPSGVLPRELKETIAAAIASVNRCPWCVDAALVMLHAGGAHDTAAALARGDYEALPLPELRAAADWASFGASPGHPALRAPPFGSEAAPEAIGTALLAHYLDRLATLFLAGSPVPRAPEALRPLLMRLTAWRHVVARRRAESAEAAPQALPEAILAEPFAWAVPAPAIATACAGMTAVLEEAGTRVLSELVVSRVHDYVLAWEGEPPSANRQWADRPFQRAGAADLASGRLALLAALAPHQVDDMVIGEFRAHFPDDRTLVEVTAWAAFAAARRIADWLVVARER